MKREEFEAKHGKLPSHAVYIDMDAPGAKGPAVRTTAGWTDDQIRGKSLDYFDAQIASNAKAIEGLRKSLRDLETRDGDLRLIRQRRLALGD